MSVALDLVYSYLLFLAQFFAAVTTSLILNELMLSIGSTAMHGMSTNISAPT